MDDKRAHAFKSCWSLGEVCEYCGESANGYLSRCCVCNYFCHTKCVNFVNVPCEERKRMHGDSKVTNKASCMSASSDISHEEGRHIFHRHHFTRPAYCNVCREFVFGVGKQGYLCNVCNLVVHDKCLQYVEGNGCKRTVAPPNELFHHHWIEGNLSVRGDFGSVCILCNSKCGSNAALVDYRCCWCRKAIHTVCKDFYTETCDFGILQKLIVPPTMISIDTAGNATCNTTKDMSPLIVFVNKKSGGQQGKPVLATFRRLLNPRQVFDLSRRGPNPGLDFVQHAPQFRVLVCGGDGTVGWVLEALRKRKMTPEVTTLPLGTGNDLARTLGWGGGYGGESILTWLLNIDRAESVKVDRWGLFASPLPVEDSEPVDVYTAISTGILTDDSPRGSVKSSLVAGYAPGGPSTMAAAEAPAAAAITSPAPAEPTDSAAATTPASATAASTEYAPEGTKQEARNAVMYCEPDETSEEELPFQEEDEKSADEVDSALLSAVLAFGSGTKVVNVINNYFSIGIDAAIALDFHLKRESNPGAFKSRVGNKLWYVKFGANAFFEKLPGLKHCISVEVDGRLLDLPDCKGVIFLNLPSCYGGKNLWGSGDVPPNPTTSLTPLPLGRPRFHSPEDG
eukprot:TRINITY_DN4375_c0_g1_i2.p1 TRINITY_DN4375_c0_g1~~TRINITY_DN4375_c0_g1_i2.p1  ORF type:complete len:623 (-),score=87.62 TRINITY_DN4375_c0_g1_i2:112-1980(-)